MSTFDPAAELAKRAADRGTLATVLHSLAEHHRPGDYIVARVVNGFNTDCYLPGQWVLVSDLNGTTCTIEHAMTAAEIDRQKQQGSLLRTWVTMIGFPMGGVDLYRDMTPVAAALRELIAERQDRDTARQLIDQWVAADRRAREVAAAVLPAEWLAESVPGEGDEPDAAEIVEELVWQLATERQERERVEKWAESLLRNLEASQEHCAGLEQRGGISCGKQGCNQPGIHRVYGSLTYHACDAHLSEIEALCKAEDRITPVAASQRAELGPCETCFTISWEPVAPDDPDAQIKPDGIGHIRCGYCWMQGYATNLRKEKQLAEQELTTLRQQLAAMRPAPPVAQPSEEEIVVDGRVCHFSRAGSEGGSWFIYSGKGRTLVNLTRDGKWSRENDPGIYLYAPTEQAARDFAKSVSTQRED